MKKKKIILIDGHYCLYQTYFSFKKLKNNSGYPTGVIYGYIKILNKLIKVFHPKHIIIIFDTPTLTFRHKLYKNYKKNRLTMPESLKKQINPLKKIITLLGIPIINMNNIEADDIIGTISRIFSKKKYSVLIYSSDKDMTQLVNKKIKIIPGKPTAKIFDKHDIYKKYGVKPKYIPDFLGLIGDRSDNIPGVTGIGKKTAILLLKNFSSIKNIYKNILTVSTLPIRNIKNITKNLKKNKKEAFLSYQLTKINNHIPLNNLKIMIEKNKLNILKLIKKFQYYQFNKYLQAIKNYTFPIINTYHQKKKKKKIYIEIKNHEILNKLIKKIIQKKIFSIAMHYLKKKNKKKFFFSIAITNKTIWWYIFHSKKKENKNFTINNMLIAIKPILENKKYKKIGIKLKNIFHILKNFNINLKGIYFDTDLIHYFYKLNNKNFFYYKHLMRDYEEKKNINKTNNKKIFLKESLISLNIYKFTKKYTTIFSKKNTFQSIDMPLLEVLAEMENNGVLIKKKILTKQKIKINNTLKKIKKKIYFLTQKKFNLNSPYQLKNILFKKYNFPYMNKTKTGHMSTKNTVLIPLSKTHILPKLILQHRKLKKIKNTYLTKLIIFINNQTSRIHTIYHQTSTSTGRLSSSNPNLQNIPIKTKTGKKIRIAFIAPKKWLLLTSDYSQIELKIMAHYSNDINLINDLLLYNDIHTKTASHIFNIHIKDVQQYHRDIAKTINFSILYGISPFGLSQKLNISLLEANKYIQLYFLKYNQIKKYKKKIYQIASKKNYIKTIFNRKIYIPNINSKNKFLKKNAKRFCVNAMIQNTASDIIKKSMINLHTIFQKNFLHDAKIIMQIHDELVFEIKEEKKNLLIKIIKFYMENSIQLIVPLSVNIKIGKNWKETKPYGLSI